MYIFWYLYFSLIGLAFFYKSVITLVVLLISGIFTIIIGRLLKKKKIEKIRFFVEKLKTKKIKRLDIEVNVNKNDWEIIKELPGFDRVSAKKVVSIRRKMGKYSSLDDFFTKNNVDDEHKKILKKIVVVK